MRTEVHMAKILQQSEIVTSISHYVLFEYVGDRGSGFSFPCDRAGNITQPLSAAAARNYAQCLENSHERGSVVCRGVCSEENSYRTPLVIECGCSKPLTLADSMTNECRCGRFYNGSGQLLSHPSQWGEETGERFDDHGYQIL
jgi:hypothetical protein